MRTKNPSRSPSRKHALRDLDHAELAQVHGGLDPISMAVGAALFYGVKQIIDLTKKS